MFDGAPSVGIMLAQYYLASSQCIRLPFMIQARREAKKAGRANELSKDGVILAVLAAIGVWAIWLAGRGHLSFAQLAHGEGVSWAGLVVAGLGHVLLIWSHLSLGKSWSPTVSKQPDHKLKTDGIYRFARHPMYGAFLLQPLACFLLCRNWALPLMWSGWIVYALSRINTEERLMVSMFGQDYVNYKQQVGALLPCRPFGFDLGLSAEECTKILNKQQ